MKLIYLAGPLGARGPKSLAHMEYLENVRQMLYFGGLVIDYLKSAVVIPGLDILLPLTGNITDEKKLKENSFELLSRCDAMLVIDISPGVKKEIKFAQKRGIPVFYDLESLKLYLAAEKTREGKNEAAVD
jgi:hypothetical protein